MGIWVMFGIDERALFTALDRTLVSILDRRIIKIAVKSFGYTVFLMFLVFLGFHRLFGQAFFAERFDGTFGEEWVFLHSFAAFFAGFAFLALLFVLIPLVVATLAGFFVDDVAEIVELTHYPESPVGTPVTFLRAAGQAVGIVGLLALGYLVLLPIWFIPGLNFLMFLVLNGYLIAREYFSGVAERYLPAQQAKILRRSNRLTLLAAGVGGVALSLIPIANFFTPLIVTVFMVHLFQILRVPQSPPH